MLRPLALAGASLVASAAIACAAAPAHAATTAPVPGTQRCTDAVNDNATVVADRNAVALYERALVIDRNGTPTGTPATVDVAAGTITGTGLSTPARLAVDQTNINTANATLGRDVNAATTAICTGTAVDDPAPTTDTPAPTTDPTSPPVTPRVPRTVPVAVIDAQIDALSCASNNGDLQRIDRAIARDQVAHVDVSEPVARLNAKLNGLNCATGAVTPRAAEQTAKDCGAAGVVVTEVQTPGTTVVETPAAGTVVRYGARTATVTTETVSPTASDGSTATLSGSEVTSAPVGSASTGA